MGPCGVDVISSFSASGGDFPNNFVRNVRPGVRGLPLGVVGCSGGELGFLWCFLLGVVCVAASTTLLRGVVCKATSLNSTVEGGDV